MLIQKSKKITYNNQIKYNCFKHRYTHTHTRGSMQSTTGVNDKIYNRNSSCQLSQTCPDLAIKTATMLELVSRRSTVRRSCKKIKKNKGQDVNQISGTSSCSERVARTHPHSLFTRTIYSLLQNKH